MPELPSQVRMFFLMTDHLNCLDIITFYILISVPENKSQELDKLSVNCRGPFTYQLRLLEVNDPHVNKKSHNH